MLERLHAFAPSARSRKTRSKLVSALATATLGFLSLNFSSCSSPNTSPRSGPATYTTLQQVFSLNILSNVSALYNGADSTTIHQQTLQAVENVLADSGVQNLIGKWNLVWGPSIIARHDSVVNTMYVVQVDTTGNPDTLNYVIAIAGTDPSSMTNWITEDFNVLGMTKWPYGNNTDTSVKITDATFTGLAALNVMRANESSGSLITEYFTGQIAAHLRKHLNIWVTGHSLGGALSPALALFLKQTFALAPNLTVKCLAVAGATPGNANFSSYYNGIMGPNTYRVWNQMDVVPHAFQPNMLAQIKTLYSQDSAIGPFPDTIHVNGHVINLNDMIIAAEALGTAYNLYQLYPSDTVNFISNYYTAPDTSKTPFLVEALYQHVPAYGVLFGIGDFQSAVGRILNQQYPFFSAKMSPVNITSYDTSGKNFNTHRF